MIAALQAILVVLFVLWMLVLQAQIWLLSRTVSYHSAILTTLVERRSDLLSEEVAAARAGLGEAVERLDISRFRERVDPEERRAD